MAKIQAKCPECEYEVDGAAGFGEGEPRTPEDGDLAICIRCAGLGIYVLQEDGTLGLRIPTIKEKVELSMNDGVQKMRDLIIEQMEPWFG